MIIKMILKGTYCSCRLKMVIEKYEDGTLLPPLPSKIETKLFKNGKYLNEQYFLAYNKCI